MSDEGAKRKRDNTTEDGESPAAKKAKNEETPSGGDYCFLTVHAKLEGSNAERVVTVGTHESFACLAEGLIQAFGYDIQRIYSFHLDGEPFSAHGPTFYSPIANKEPTSVDSLLAEISWSEGQSLLLLYDYAACHNFTLTIKQITMKAEPQPIEVDASQSQGTAPEQQPDTSDDEFEISEGEDLGYSSEEAPRDSDEDDDYKP